MLVTNRKSAIFITIQSVRNPLISRFPLSSAVLRLSLRELACSSCFLETVLLSFFHSGISCQESSSLEGRSVSFSVSFAESSGNSVSECACLTSVTTAMHCSDHVKLAFASSNFKRSLNLSLYDFLGKVIIERFLVYCDISVTRDYYNSSN